MKRYLTVVVVLCAVLALGAAAGTTYRSVVNFAAGLTSAGDIEVAATGTIEGIPKLKLVSLGTMTNGTTENICYIDDSPTGEWTEVDAGTAVTLTADTAVKKVGANSLKMAFTAAAVIGDGAVNNITDDDLSANESVGFWIYSTRRLDAGDMYVLFDDDGATDPEVDIPAVAPNVWTWVELDISTALDAGDVIGDVSILWAEAPGVACSVYFDFGYKWDAANEEALGVDLVGAGAVVGVSTVVDANTGAHAQTIIAENTDYFVNWQSGNDVLVTVTDQSTKSALAIVAYQ